MTDPTQPEQTESTEPVVIDWLVEARHFYTARGQAADQLTLQLMAHHMERVFNQEINDV